MNYLDFAAGIAPGNVYCLVWLPVRDSIKCRLAAIEMRDPEGSPTVSPATVEKAAYWLANPLTIPESFAVRVARLNLIASFHRVAVSEPVMRTWPLQGPAVLHQEGPEYQVLAPFDIASAKAEIRQTIYDWHLAYRSGVWLKDYILRGLDNEAALWMRGEVDYFPLENVNGTLVPLQPRRMAA
jgi:hypothetical protein